MKSSIIVLFIFSLTLCFCCNGKDVNKITLKFSYQNSENPPYQIGNGPEINMVMPGLAVEMILLVAERLGINVKLSRVSWKRGLYLLRSNKIDGLFNASFKSERQKYGAYPVKNNIILEDLYSYINSYHFYKLKGFNFKWDGSNLEKGTTVGATRGFSIVGDLRKLGATVYEANNTAQNFRKLIQENLDLVADLTTAGDAVLRNNLSEFSEIIKIEPPIKTKKYYLMLSHKLVNERPELSYKIWETIAIVRESKEFLKVIEKYFKTE